MTTPTIETLRNHTDITSEGYALLSGLVSQGSPDVLVSGAPEASAELVTSGLLRETADRYEVSAAAWVALRKAEEDEASAAHDTEMAAHASRKIRVRGLTKAQAAWCHRALNDAGYDTDHDPTETIEWGATWIEGTVEDLEQTVASLEQMAFLIVDDTTCEYTHSNFGGDIPEALAERLRDQAIKCCETAASKIQDVL
jgi:hypothetical protein